MVSIKPDQSPKRRTSSKQRSLTINTKSRPLLALDTSCSNHISNTPQQIQPYKWRLLRSKNAGTSHLAKDGNLKVDPPTPCIVVTPAKEEFDHIGHLGAGRRRIPSSVYSRYTDIETVETSVPPIPPLPAYLRAPHGSITKPDAKGRVTTVSVCTVFEEDAMPPNTAKQQPEPLSAHRSRGWWNLITSPFSASSNFPFWRSPTNEHDDQTPILGGQNRSIQTGSERLVSKDSMTMQSTRQSMTASMITSTPPSALDIYRVPSQGEAAPYYDLTRHFPSLLFDPATAAVAAATVSSDKALPGGHENLRANPFSTPQADELCTPPPLPMHSTLKSNASSPLSPSPILEHAKAARSTNCEQVQVDVSSSRIPSPLLNRGLAATTMASKPAVPTLDKRSSTCGSKMPIDSPAPAHNRQYSRGLGISELPEPTAVLEEKREMQSAGGRRPWYRRFFWPILLSICLLLALLTTLLVMLIPQKHQDASVQGQWTSIAGFPALVTGVTTVIRPRIIRQEDRCTTTVGAWTCVSNTDGNALPNFRFEIRASSGSPSNGTSQHRKRSAATVSASSIIRNVKLPVRDLWSDQLYGASPAPPTMADQVFVGNTTDNNTAPFEGEVTPFYLSLVEPSALLKRQDSVYPLPQEDNSTSSDQSIPKLVLGAGGRPMSDTLYPRATAQPLRLYKRGQHDEHYGFYVYYDKSVTIPTGIAAWPNASAVCTWSQSRFLVQIWTQTLLANASTALSSSNSTNSATTAGQSSANDMSTPGSFPYPVTITIDRHGGQANKKGAYCYKVEASGRVDQSSGTWIDENRSFGGVLINGAAVPGANSTGTTSQVGVIDGGNGGCACGWQNW